MKQEIKSIGIIEVGESVFYIEKTDTHLTAGTACNVGIIEHYKTEYDDCFSLDENLQSFVEMINEKEAEPEPEPEPEQEVLRIRIGSGEKWICEFHRHYADKILFRSSKAKCYICESEPEPIYRRPTPTHCRVDRQGVRNSIKEFGVAKAIQYYQTILDKNDFTNNSGAWHSLQYSIRLLKRFERINKSEPKPELNKYEGDAWKIARIAKPKPEPKPMTISVRIGSEDEKLFIEIVNQGIDSRLEAFTDSLFRGEFDRLYLDFAESELSILLRRLSESDNENAEQWENDILLSHYGIEII